MRNDKTGRLKIERCLKNEFHDFKAIGGDIEVSLKVNITNNKN